MRRENPSHWERIMITIHEENSPVTQHYTATVLSAAVLLVQELRALGIELGPCMVCWSLFSYDGLTHIKSGSFARELSLQTTKNLMTTTQRFKLLDTNAYILGIS